MYKKIGKIIDALRPIVENDSASQNVYKSLESKIDEIMSEDGDIDSKSSRLIIRFYFQLSLYQPNKEIRKKNKKLHDEDRIKALAKKLLNRLDP